MRYHPKVSMVMPTYNSKQFVHIAIESIINQTFDNWELIIVDDGSTDGTNLIINSFQDPRIKLIRLNKNYGNYYARNIGIQKSSGKYIAMFDSDDISHPNRLEIQHNFLEKHKHIGAIGTNFHVIDTEGKLIGKVKRPTNNSTFRTALLNDNPMLQSTIMVRKHLIEKYQLYYNITYRYAADYDFVFKCSKHFKIFNLKDYGVSYRINPNGITKQKCIEQQTYAFKIREDIIKYFFKGIESDQQIELFNQIFHQECNIHKIDISEVENLFNFFLSVNSRLKNFNQNLLYTMFEKRLTEIYLEKRTGKNSNSFFSEREKT